MTRSKPQERLVWRVIRWVGYSYAIVCVVIVTLGAVVVLPQYQRVLHATEQERVRLSTESNIPDLSHLATEVFNKSFLNQLDSLYYRFLDKTETEILDPHLPSGEVTIYYYPDRGRLAATVGLNTSCNCPLETDRYNKLITSITTTSGHLELGDIAALDDLSRARYPLLWLRKEDPPTDLNK